MSTLPNFAALFQPLRRRAGRWLAPRRAAQAEIAGYCAEIETCRVSLLGFGTKSDEEFTALARGLGKLTSRANELRDQTAELERTLDNRDEDRALDAAYALYKSSVDLVHASAGLAVSAGEQLGRIEKTLIAVGEGREKFRRNHLLLNVLAISVRIEAARVAPEHRSVFLNVAADTAEIGAKILNGMETAFGGIDEVIRETHAERADLKNLDQVIAREARERILVIQRELDGLKQALAPCAEKSREISAMFAGTSPQTMRVISSLQHQDIVRQQLEHVAEGFQDMAEHLRKHGSIEWTYVQRADAVQEAQIGAARRDIAQAGAEVIGGLQGLLKSHAAMVGLFVAMEQTAASALGDCRVAQSFAEEIHELAGMIERSEAANTRISRLVEHIRQVVEVFTEGIARQEFELKLVALNAQIAAARLPAADALNKIAEETSAASNANAAVTCELVTSLRAGLGQLNKVKEETDEFLKVVNREKVALETGTDTVKEKLGRLLQRVQTGALHVRQEFEPLFRESQALVESVDFPQLIDVSFAPAEALCTRIKETAAVHADGKTLSADAAASLERHQKRYTMRQENATHSAALVGSAVVASAAVAGDPELFGEPAPAAPTPAEPGDIELFGAEETPPATIEAPAPAAAGEIELFAPAAPAAEPAPDCPAPASEVAGAPAAASPAAPEPARSAKSPAVSPPAAASPDFGDGIELF